MREQTGDFTDVHDFVARQQNYFPDDDLSVNAGQAFAEASALDLLSVDRLKSQLGVDALDPRTARGRIDDFIAYLVEINASER